MHTNSRSLKCKHTEGHGTAQKHMAWYIPCYNYIWHQISNFFVFEVLSPLIWYLCTKNIAENQLTLRSKHLLLACDTCYIFNTITSLWYIYCFQLNTEWTQIEVIDLVNDGSGLGFGIIGGRSTGVVVKTILPGGIADVVCIVDRQTDLRPFNNLSVIFWLESRR